MAFYQGIKDYDSAEKRRWIATRLVALRAALNERIGAERDPRAIVIGSWNIRAFDGGRPRLDESYHYIAEVIDHFDICALQEVRPDLRPLRRLMGLLGPSWDYFVSDVTDGDSGNHERMAFLYDTRKVRFRNLIGELVIDGVPIARTPFFAAFQADWFKFTLCSAHITFGEQTLRQREIEAIATVLAKRGRKEEEMYVFLGDMNIERLTDPTFQAMTAQGLTVPLFGPTNLGGTSHFDQIAFTGDGIETHLIRHGAFDWRGAVYRASDRDHYRTRAESSRGTPYADWTRSYPGWTTHEMSDHLPIWVEVRTDYSDQYLAENFIGNARR